LLPIEINISKNNKKRTKHTNTIELVEIITNPIKTN
jgi:hypothetical protein